MLLRFNLSYFELEQSTAYIILVVPFSVFSQIA